MMLEGVLEEIVTAYQESHIWKNYPSNIEAGMKTIPDMQRLGEPTIVTLAPQEQLKEV